MSSREANKTATVIIQERDGDAWGHNDITGGLDSGFILEEEPSRWIGGVMEREGSGRW